MYQPRWTLSFLLFLDFTLDIFIRAVRLLTLYNLLYLFCCGHISSFESITIDSMYFKVTILRTKNRVSKSIVPNIIQYVLIEKYLHIGLIVSGNSFVTHN